MKYGMLTVRLHQAYSCLDEPHTWYSVLQHSFFLNQCKQSLRILNRHRHIYARNSDGHISTALSVSLKGMSQQHFKVCFCFRRIFRLRRAEPPEDVKVLFQVYSENGTMSIDHLLRFLIEFQGEVNATKEDAQATFDSLKHLNIFQRRGLHLEAFFRYLLGDQNLPLISSSLGVHHDMESPLAHYFLCTGHNSYLAGNQLTSDSGVDPIIRALKNSVRVIELDLWPNSTKDDVDVCHGGTLTDPVELIKCLQAIKDYAFYSSDYPVVITFEDHLTPNLQAKVAQMVTKTFGAMLFFPKSDLVELPSPDSLKKRIMISTKPPVEPFSDESDQGDDHLDEDLQNEAPEYRRLIAIHAVKLKGRLENMLTVDSNKVLRLSLSEQELQDAATTNGSRIVRFTRRNLLRVYPKGTRVDSSNYNPLVGWMHGAQMVAMNMQGYGKNLWRMQGMFRANGGCGYIKKPGILLNDDPYGQVFNPSETTSIKTVLKVKLYMGEGWHSDFRHTHFDLYSPPDFYAKLSITGVPADSMKKKSRPIEDEWIPAWNEEFEFPLTVPELALLRIEVRDYDTTGKHDLAGQTCLPVSELRTGIRSVPLHDHKGEKYESVKLLMSFNFD